MPLEALVNKVVALATARTARQTLIVITGGEPFRQNLTNFTVMLLGLGFAVQVETNGTFAPSEGLPKQVYIVCSPKAGKVAGALLPRISAYKYVIDGVDYDPTDGLPTSILGAPRRPARPHPGYKGPIYISPMDTGDDHENEFNRSVAVKVCMERNYILNLQLHKLLGLP